MAGCRATADCGLLFAGWIGPFRDQCGETSRQSCQNIAGADANDSTSTTAPVPNYQAEAEKPVKGLPYWHPKEYFGVGMDPEVRKNRSRD